LAIPVLEWDAKARNLVTLIDTLADVEFIQENEEQVKSAPRSCNQQSHPHVLKPSVAQKDSRCYKRCDTPRHDL